MPIAVEIVSQEKSVFSLDDADSVQIPASEGEMGVLPNHAPVLTTLGHGELIVRRGNAEERFAVFGGVVDVRPNKVTVLAELAESSFELDMEAIEAARANARKMMEEGVGEAPNRQAVLELRRAEMHLKIARRVQGQSILRIIDQSDKDNE